MSKRDPIDIDNINLISSSESEDDSPEASWQQDGTNLGDANLAYLNVSPPNSPRNPTGLSLLSSTMASRNRSFKPRDEGDLIVRDKHSGDPTNVTHIFEFRLPERVQLFFDNLSPLIKAVTEKLKKERDYITPLKSAGMGMFYLFAIFVLTVSLVYFIHSIEYATQYTSLADFAFVWKNMFAFVVYHLCKHYWLSDRTSSVVFVVLIMLGHFIPDLDLLKYSNHKDVDNLPILEKFDELVFTKDPDYHGLSMLHDLFAIRTACALNFSQFNVSSSLTPRCLDTLNNVFDIFNKIYLPAFMEITSNSDFSFPPEIQSEVRYVVQGDNVVEETREYYQYKEVVKKDWNENACFNETIDCEKFLQMMCFLDRRMLNGQVYRKYYKQAKIIARAAEIVSEKTVELHDQLDEVPYGNTLTTLISSKFTYGAFIRDTLKLWGKIHGYLANYNMLVSLFNIWGNTQKLTEYVHPAAVPKMKDMLKLRYIEWVNETFVVNKVVRMFDHRKLHAPNVTQLKLAGGAAFFKNLVAHDYEKFIQGLEQSMFEGCPFKTIDEGVNMLKGCPVLAPVCVNVVEGHVKNQLDNIKVNCDNKKMYIDELENIITNYNNNNRYIYVNSTAHHHSGHYSLEMTRQATACKPCQPCLCQSANLSCHVSEPSESKSYSHHQCRVILGLQEEDRSLGFADANEYLKYTVAVSVLRASPLIIGIFRGLNRYPLKHKAILSAFVSLTMWNWYDEISAVRDFIGKSLYTAANSTVAFVRKLVRAGTPVMIGVTIMGGVVYMNACQPPIDMSWRVRVTEWRKQFADWWAPKPEVATIPLEGDAATIRLVGDAATMRLDGAADTMPLDRAPVDAVDIPDEWGNV